MGPITAQLTNSDMSVEILGDAFSLEGVANGFSVMVFYSGSPNGTLRLEGRNGPNCPFLALPANQYSASVTGPGNQVWEYVSANFREVRLHWIPGGGSGLLSAYWYARRA